MVANDNFQLLSESYLFAEVSRRVSTFRSRYPDADVIRMDIGDVTLPIVKPVADAMIKATGEMLVREGFHGYGPEQGYVFLREAVSYNDYKARNIEIDAEEIFISDGAKCDIANLTDLFGIDCVVGIPNPVYPVYVDSNIMAGRTVDNGGIVLIECNPADDYRPRIPASKVDVVYLCSPNNPTGSVIDRVSLKAWVSFAASHGSIIIFDSAYEAFIRDTEVPRSIYEIEGARKVALEVRSFSKTAGFTGLRCGYTVVPRDITVSFPDGSSAQLWKLWLRRQTTKFNGASYVVQRGAEAIYSPAGQTLVKANVDYYLRNAGILKEAFEKLGFRTTGGTNSPYVWIKDTEGRDSWELFDLLLHQCGVSTTPGVGFGTAGQGCVRLTGFNTFENTKNAIRRFEAVLLSGTA